MATGEVNGEGKVSDALLERVEFLLNRIVRREVMDVLNTPIIRNSPRPHKETVRKRVVIYNLTDGVRSSPEVARSAPFKITQRTVSNWWQAWIREGIALESDVYKGRARKIIDLPEIEDE